MQCFRNGICNGYDVVGRREAAGRPGEMDIIRIDSRAGTKEIVKTIHSDSAVQYRHPHPQLNAAGDRLLFIENSDLEPNLASVTLRSMVC